MSLAETKLITEQEVKNYTDLPNNLKTSNLSFSITVAQDLYIRSAIGEDLYSELLDQTQNDTLTALNLTLLNGDDRLFRGIKFALAWWVAYEVYPYLHTKVTPTGIQTKSTDEAISADSRDVEMRRNIAKKKAEYYLDQLIKYLCDKDTDYPLFRDNSLDNTTILYDGYGQSGIVLDDEDYYEEWERKKRLTREDLD
jgi:hypothetical protein